MQAPLTAADGAALAGIAVGARLGLKEAAGRVLAAGGARAIAGRSVDYFSKGAQALIKRPYIPAGVRSALGMAPRATMHSPHIHHILSVNGRAGAERALAREGQDILRHHGIDPLKGIENLTWAPNKGHTIKATESLVTELRISHQNAASRSDIVDILTRHGKVAGKR